MKSILKKSIIASMIMILVVSMMTGCNKTEPAKEEENKAETTEVSKFEDNQYFVDADWLNQNIDSENLIVLDARGEKEYLNGHIKNSMPVQWQGFAKMDVKPGEEGFGVLLDSASLSEKLSELGITKDSKVVVYAAGKDGWGDDGRIVWMLKMAGIKDAKMLSQSFAQWTESGFEVSKEVASANKSDFALDQLDMAKSIDTKTLIENYDSYVIIDTRTKEEYDGAVKYGEARGGHLPGAILVQYEDLFNEDKTLKDSDSLEKLFADLGIKKEDKIVTYCTAGIRSAYMQLVLEMLGYEDTMNYDASFYEWAGNQNTEVESN